MHDLVGTEVQSRPVAFEQGLAWIRPSDLGPELWVSDGTVVGTRPRFVLPGEVAMVEQLTLAGGALFYEGYTDGLELWRTDGTLEGTVRLLALSTNPLGTSTFTAWSGQVYFLAPFDRTMHLWRTDGTAEGTVPLLAEGSGLPARSRGLFATDSTLYAVAFDAATGGHDPHLWRLDGTPTGSEVLAERAVLSTENPRFRTIVGNQVYFLAGTREEPELWVSNGTVASTQRVAPLPQVPFDWWIADDGLRAYFPGTDEAHGQELWTSDGTAAGTRIVQDVAPGPRSSSPSEVVSAGSSVYLALDDWLHGRELWGGSQAGCATDERTLCLGGRYAVEVSWTTSTDRGEATPRPLTGDTGAFWFFSADNLEVMIKILDGTGINQHAWVFYAALSNVEYVVGRKREVRGRAGGGPATQLVRPGRAPIGDPDAVGTGEHDLLTRQDGGNVVPGATL